MKFGSLALREFLLKGNGHGGRGRETVSWSVKMMKFPR